MGGGPANLPTPFRSEGLGPVVAAVLLLAWCLASVAASDDATAAAAASSVGRSTAFAVMLDSAPLAAMGAVDPEDPRAPIRGVDNALRTPLIAIGVLLLAAGGIGAWFGTRRRHRSDDESG